MGKIKNGGNIPILEVVEVVLVQYNLVDNQYQQKSEELNIFLPNKCNLVFLKIYNTEFDETIIIFTDQNGRPLEIEDKVNSTLLINK